jgi:hypothetical protein
MPNEHIVAQQKTGNEPGDNLKRSKCERVRGEWARAFTNRSHGVPATTRIVRLKSAGAAAPPSRGSVAKFCGDPANIAPT